MTELPSADIMLELSLLSRSSHHSRLKGATVCSHGCMLKQLDTNKSPHGSR